MAINPDLLVLTLLNGIALGLLYVLIASGLTLIFGVTDILNFTHGALYMLGAYFGLVVLDLTGNFWATFILAPLGVGCVGLILERSTLQHIYDRDPLYHILLTFGLTLMLSDTVKFVFGGGQQAFGTPPALVGGVDLGGVFFPKYKFFIIAISTLIAFSMWALLKYTSFGLILRAGAQRADTVRLMGIDSSKYFSLVFVLGSVLAGAAGVLSGPFLNVSPVMGDEIIIKAFIIVILGGLGSFRGSVLAALLIGVTETLGQTFLPALTGYYIYLLLIITLLIRPQGLLGEYEVRVEEAKLQFEEIIKPISIDDPRLLTAVAVFAIFPLIPRAFVSTYYVSLLSLIFIWAIFAVGLDIVMGQLGLLSFGHAAFFGIGAYAAALFTLHVYNSFLIALVFAAVLVAVISWAVGALSIRLAGVYFAIITLAMAQMFYELSIGWASLTGGSNGLRGLPAIKLLGFDLTDPVLFYYLSFVLLLVIYALLVRLTETPFGRAATAIRESEQRMSFLGYNTDKYKRRAFTLSGAIGGIAGVLFATYQNFASPNALHWSISGDALFVVLLGGINTLFGPILGAGAFIGIEQLLSTRTDMWRFFLGLLLVLMVLFAPRGFVSVYQEIKSRLGGGFSVSASNTDSVDDESIDVMTEKED